MSLGRRLGARGPADPQSSSTVDWRLIRLTADGCGPTLPRVALPLHAGGRAGSRWTCSCRFSDLLSRPALPTSGGVWGETDLLLYFCVPVLTSQIVRSLPTRVVPKGHGRHGVRSVAFSFNRDLQKRVTAHAPSGRGREEPGDRDRRRAGDPQGRSPERVRQGAGGTPRRAFGSVGDGLDA